MKGTPGWVVIVASAVMAFGICGGLFGEGAEVAPPSEGQVKPEETKTAEEIAVEVEQEKALKQQEAEIQGKKHSDAADAALKEGKYDVAIEELNAAVAADPENEAHKEKLQAARISQINAALSQKKFAAAKAFCDAYLADYPGDDRVTRFREQAVAELEKPATGETQEEAVIAPPAAKTADQLLAEAEDYILRKDYQKAKDKLLDAQKLSPYEVKIDKRIKQVQEQLSRYERAYYEAMREELMTQIYAAWTKRPRRAVRPEEIEALPIEKKSPAREEMLRKLDQVIPEVRFEDAKLREVVEYLSQEADVNIVIDPSVFTGYAPTSMMFGPTTGMPGVTPTPGTSMMPGGPTITPGTDFFTPGVTTPGFPTPSSVMPGVTPGVPETPGTTPTWMPPVSDTGISIRLVNVPLRDVLKYVLQYKRLKYVVEDFAILIVPVDYVPPESLETEIFRLATTGIGIVDRPSLTGPGTGPYEPGTGRPSQLGGPMEVSGGDTSTLGEPAGPTTTQTVKEFLFQSGVPWPRGSNIIFNSRTGTLIVSNTPTNMILVRELVHLWDQPALQVEIEARFVEILHTRWFENSFQAGLLSPLVLTQKAKGGPVPPGVRRRVEVDVRPERGTRFFPQLLPTEFPTPDADQILSLRGFMTEPEFQFIWRAIDQKDWSDLLSAPRIATISGQQAQIEVVQEITYPTEYDTETINIGGGFGGQTNLISGEVFMVTPGNWEKRDVGIILNVTPSVSADGRMITLVLMPEVTDLVRWINYGNELYPIQQPVFETRNVTTTVYVNDGETIVLGGLITDKTTTYQDKVPILGSIPFVGRFFRTNAETTSKANLVIFVTARLITSRGTELAEERAITEAEKKRLERGIRESKEEIGEVAPGVGTTGIIE